VLISSCNLLIPFPVSDVGEVLLTSSPEADVPPWLCTKCFNSEKNIKNTNLVSSNIYILRAIHITDSTEHALFEELTVQVIFS
jgi:hypothetical protein